MMNARQPGSGRIGHAKRVLLGLAALGACLAACGCASYRGERAQFEGSHVTVYPASPNAAFSAGSFAAVPDRR